MVYFWTDHDAQIYIELGCITKTVIPRYKIDDTCDISRWLSNCWDNKGDNTNLEYWWLLSFLPVRIKTIPGYEKHRFTHIILVTSSQNQTGSKYCRFRTDHVLTTERWKPCRVVINTGLSESIYKSIIKRCSKTANPKEICKAFHGLPGPRSRLFMGCQAAELNHFPKPFKMDLNL